MSEPLDFLAARKQLYPDHKHIAVDSPECKAILKLSKKSGFKTLEERVAETMPPAPRFDWAKMEQPINRPLPIINMPPMSKAAFLEDPENRAAFTQHLNNNRTV